MHKSLGRRVAKLAMMASIGFMFGSGCAVEQLVRIGVRSVGGVEGFAALIVNALTTIGTDTGTGG